MDDGQKLAQKAHKSKTKKSKAKAVAKKGSTKKNLKRKLASKKQLKLTLLLSYLEEFSERYDELDDNNLINLYNYLILTLHDGFKKDFETIEVSDPFIVSTAVDNDLTKELDIGDNDAITDYVENLIIFIDTLKDTMKYTPILLDARFKEVFHHKLKDAKRIILKQKDAPMNENAPKRASAPKNKGMNELGDLFAGMGGIGHKPDIMLKEIDDLEKLMGELFTKSSAKN